MMTVDELTGDFVLSGASAHGKSVVLAPWYRRGEIPKVHIYIFDYELEKGWELNDGRIQTSILVQILSNTNGFVLSDNYLGNLFFLDTDGKFHDNDRLASFSGYSSEYKVKKVFSYEDDLILATLAHVSEPEKKRIAVIDLAQRRISVMHETICPGSSRFYWVPAVKGLLAINPEKGTIDLLDWQRFVLQRALFRAGDRFQRKGRDLPILTLPQICNNKLFLRLNSFVDKSGKILKKPQATVLMIDLEDLNLSVKDSIRVVGQQGTKQLLFDIREREFRLMKNGARGF